MNELFTVERTEGVPMRFADQPMVFDSLSDCQHFVQVAIVHGNLGDDPFTIVRYVRESA